VATVVAKLLAGLRPAAAVFGRKDAQQLAVVRRLVSDLSFPVEIVGAPTVRAPDGLALSSRNAFLGAEDRLRAVALSGGLMEAVTLAGAGERRSAVLEAAVRATIRAAGLEPEYVTLADAATAAPVDVLERECFLATAVPVGRVRLIDNVFLWPDGSADTGVWGDET
jgi:pantoate--beta-alanine ligase